MVNLQNISPKDCFNFGPDCFPGTHFNVSFFLLNSSIESLKWVQPIHHELNQVGKVCRQQLTPISFWDAYNSGVSSSFSSECCLQSEVTMGKSSWEFIATSIGIDLRVWLALLLKLMK